MFSVADKVHILKTCNRFCLTTRNMEGDGAFSIAGQVLIWKTENQMCNTDRYYGSGGRGFPSQTKSFSGRLETDCAVPTRSVKG